MKLCILGFDALDVRILEQAESPRLRQFRETGQWGTLISEVMRTGPCWTTILTGKRIETHGVTHLLGYPGGGAEWFGSRPRDYIFDYIHDAGYCVGVANFPSILFARDIGRKLPKIVHWMIGGWPNRPNIAPESYRDYLPIGLYSDLPDYETRELNHRKPPGAMLDWSIHEVPWGEYIDWATENAWNRVNVIEDLPEVEVLMIQESVLDRAGHMLSTPNKGKLGRDDSRYNEAIGLVEDLIEWAQDSYNPDFLAIVSDHGYQGLSEADPKHGCRHSKRGVWGLLGPGIINCRIDTDQENFAPTVLDAIGITMEECDGYSQLMAEDSVERALKGLGYI
jgi:hypothetical protein